MLRSSSNAIHRLFTFHVKSINLRLPPIYSSRSIYHTTFLSSSSEWKEKKVVLLSWQLLISSSNQFHFIFRSCSAMKTTQSFALPMGIVNNPVASGPTLGQTLFGLHGHMGQGLRPTAAPQGFDPLDGPKIRHPSRGRKL